MVRWGWRASMVAWPCPRWWPGWSGSSCGNCRARRRGPHPRRTSQRGPRVRPAGQPLRRTEPARPPPRRVPHQDRLGCPEALALLTASYSLQGYVGYIFVFWFYLYLVQVRHFDLLRGAFLSSLPWVLSIVSIPLGGVVSDRLARGRHGPGLGPAARRHDRSGWIRRLHLARGAHGQRVDGSGYLALATAPRAQRRGAVLGDGGRPGRRPERHGERHHEHRLQRRRADLARADAGAGGRHRLGERAARGCRAGRRRRALWFGITPGTAPARSRSLLPQHAQRGGIRTA